MKVRIDFFKPSGKWYTDDYLDWCTGTLPAYARDQLQATLRAGLQTERGYDYNGMIAVCREDDVEGPGYPVMGFWKDGNLYPLFTSVDRCMRDIMEEK